MNKTICTALMDTRTLAPTQLADLQTGVAAVEAFWAAVEANPFPGKPVLLRCILAALCVHDILHSIGRQDAVLFRTGLEVYGRVGAFDHSLMIGDPIAPKLDGQWNAHMTVRLGDILIDPSHGQTKRDWNESPRAAALKFTHDGSSIVNVRPGFDVKASLSYVHTLNGIKYRVTYFKLPISVDLRTKKWRSLHEAKPELRRSLVERAAAIYRDRRTENPETLAA